jgi:S-DNA-T family DNA segregation ATPase FtsK/SpoIIIE
LVAGTSGSGKSELLQTLIASLALGNRPDAMSFVLVDYKGGSAFKDAALLPHCAGLVTDLDEHLVARALASLTAELTRRERVLAAAGAKDIEELWTLESRDDGDAPTALPRLVIVVDEFASLVEEVPDFVKGVVGIGMRGRSLGVHVVLATQRPAGVVTGEIRANVNLRIALRVTSPGDSTDVVDTPEAAHISSRTPGRAFLRTGHGELTAFQAARVGWPVGDAAATDGERARAVRRDVTGLGSTRVNVAGEVTEDGRTDLSHLVRTVVAANEALGARPVASPWLPPLPETLVLADVPAAPAGGAAVGLVDRPARQAQEPFVLDIARIGSVLVAGTVRSGRSSALRTIAAALTTGHSPADVHLYALDCGNRALSVLADLPHCGAVVDGDDQPRVERLLAALDDEVARRQRLLGAGGYASVDEARAAGTELSQVVVLVDRLEAFLARYTEHDAGRPVDALERLLRQGPAVGVAFVLAADRTGLTPRLASAVSGRLVLRQADRDDVAVFGLSPRDVPAELPPGRGIWVSTGEEVQLALLDADSSGAAQVDALRGLAADATTRWADVPGDRLPRRLDPLPETITLAELEQRRTGPAPRGGSVAVVAAGGDALGPIDLDLAAAGPCFVVSGTARSGRSTALTSLVRSVLGRPDALPVLVVTPRPSPLRDLARLPGVTAVLCGGPDLAVDLEDVLAAHPDGLMLVVDDAELLTEGREGTVLEEVVRTARDTGTVVVAGATTEDLLLNRYRGWLATARRCRTGLLLGPVSPTDGEVFELRLPRSGAAAGPVGRALLVQHGGWMPVQVPRP